VLVFGVQCRPALPDLVCFWPDPLGYPSPSADPPDSQSGMLRFKNDPCEQANLTSPYKLSDTQ
jgi:hypothetical protein